MDDGELSAPPGFERHFRQSPVTVPWEPLWSRRDGARFRLGLHVAQPHCNSRGMLHGGIISALSDNAMGLACVFALGGNAGLVTVQLSVEYLGAARQGDWLEIVAIPAKTGRTLSHASADVFAGEKLVARATAIFHNPAPRAG